MSEPQLAPRVPPDLTTPPASDADVARGPAHPRLGAALILIIGTGLAGLILNASPLINGSSYWRWAYRATPAHIVPTLAFAAGAAALVLVALALHGRRGRVAAALSIIVIAAAFLRAGTSSLGAQGSALGFIGYAVYNPIVGSYYSAAEMLRGRDALLPRFHERMHELPLHATNKPPGPVLVNLMFMRVLGEDPRVTAVAVGVACGVVSLLCVPMLYAFMRVIGASARAGLHAAGLWAVVPGAAIFFPLFDPLLTVPVLGMAITWALAMRTGRPAWAAAMGAALGLTLLFTFNVLPIGTFLAVMGLVLAPGGWAARLLRSAALGAVVLVVALGLQLAFALATGFNPIATVGAALINQGMLLELVPRPYPQTVWWDLVDFALGLAWIPVLLTAAYLMSARPRGRPTDAVVIAGVAQVILTATTGLLPGETARVWNFLIPLSLVPAALELARWPAWAAAIAYATTALLATLLAGHMVFLFAP